MQLSGAQYIGNSPSNKGSKTFFGINPALDISLEGEFYEATAEEVDQAVEKAHSAFYAYRATTPEQKATFLERIGEEILALGEVLIERSMAETALPEGRLKGERGRTVNQLKLFAQVVREGSWVEARIDRAQPDRKPFPKADIRSMAVPLGPVGIFGASNFPLAFSVAGGDTASALAAGCPIVVKGHPAHPGTSELVGRAIIAAAVATGMPDGVFSLLHGTSHEVGQAIVKHPLIQAVGFTGSFRGGKALFDAANQREVPIPVYAEMGSTNPVFILPGAMKERGELIAKGLAGSVTLGVGQFCTNPGMVFGLSEKSTDQFVTALTAEMASLEPGTMLTAGIAKAYQEGVASLSKKVEKIADSQLRDSPNFGQGKVFLANTQDLIDQPSLSEEVFGPSTIVFKADHKANILEVARKLEGHLTATIHGTEADLEEYKELMDILQDKVGRIVFNSYPTGVEVCPSMVHGGPFPATTDSKTTSVGTLAIKRFARPYCYQGFPQSVLPDALKDGNPLGIWRMVDGNWAK